MECNLYLIPLKKFPIFKIGNSLDVASRMKNMGIMGYADHKKIMVITLPDKGTALRLEKAIGRMLSLYSICEGIPDDILNGRTEFFRIDAWDYAVELITNLRKYGWDYKVALWSRLGCKSRPPKASKIVSNKILAARLEKLKKQKAWERYNRQVFSRFWVHQLRLNEDRLLGFRYANTIAELNEHRAEILHELAKIDSDNSLSPIEKNFVRGMYLCGLGGDWERWVLVYDDEDGSVFDSLFRPHLLRGGKIVPAPSVKMSGGSSLFPQASYCDGISVVAVSLDSLGYPGTEPLIDLLHGYNGDFCPTAKPWHLR